LPGPPSRPCPPSVPTRRSSDLTRPTPPPRWRPCPPRRPRRLSWHRWRTRSTTAHEFIPAADGSTAPAPSSNARCRPAGRRRCAPTRRSSSAPSRSSTRSLTRMRPWRWPTTPPSASAARSSAMTSRRPSAWPTGSTREWCGSTRPPGPNPICPSEARSVRESAVRSAPRASATSSIGNSSAPTDPTDVRDCRRRHMDLNIRGRTALVTGASSGIGLETARQLLDEGAIVVMTGPEPDRLKAAVDELEEHKKRIYAHDADIADDASVDDLAAKVTAEVGDLDILVNVAGIHGAGGLFHEISQDGWDRTIDVDLMGPVRVTRAFLPGLRRGGWGRIVFVSSEDAVQPYDDELPYCVAKAGMLSL